MTVQELINRLQELDPNTNVYTRGYEGGVDDIDNIESIKVDRDVNTSWYYGKHETSNDGSPGYLIR